MGRYTVIADLSEEIVRTLKEELVPDVILDQNGIGLCSPSNTEEYSLGIFLYDIQESDEIRQLHMLDINARSQQGPPAYLSLYYMITAYSQSDQKFQMIQEERILGRVIQHFHDNPVLMVSDEEIKIQMLHVSTEDKTKLWNFNGKPYTISIFYKAAPVMLESAMVRDVVRVRGAEIDVQNLHGNGSRVHE